MDLNNLYNFKNAVRHFVDIDSLEYPDDVKNIRNFQSSVFAIPFLYIK